MNLKFKIGILSLLVIATGGFFIHERFQIISLKDRSRQAIADEPSLFTPQLFISGDKDYYSSGGLISLTSAEEPAVQLVSYNLSGEATVEVYRAGEPELLDFLMHDKDNKQIKKDPDMSKLQFVKSFKQTVTQNDTTPPKVLLPIGDSGIWFLKISVGSTSDRAFVVRSHNGLLVKKGDNNYVFWSQNFDSKRSQTQGTVRLFNLQDQQQELADVDLNSDGLATTKLDERADIAILESGTDIAVLPINLNELNAYSWHPFQPSQPQTDHFVFTDRPVYKPGDTLFFKAISRDDNDGKLTLPSGQYKVDVFKDWNESQPVFEKNYFVGANGSIAGQIDLDKNLATGDYQLKISRPESQPNVFPYSSSYISFQVEYYRKPEYSLDLSVGSTELVAGDKVPVKVRGSYFFGQPLAGQSVHYTIYSADFYDYDYLSSLSYALNDDYRYGYWGGGIVKEGDVTLDAKGEAAISLDTKAAQFTKSQVFSVEVKTNDQTQNPAFARKNIVVYPSEFGLYRKDQGFYAKVGDNMNMPVVLVAHRGSAISGVKLTAHVLRQSWVSYNVPNQIYPSYREEDENLPDLTATTDSLGNADFNFIVKKSGSYRITVEGRDTNGNLTTKDFYAWASDQSYSWWGGDNNSSRLSVKTDKQQYVPGESANLTISSAIADRDVLLSLQRGYSHSYQVVHLSGNGSNVVLPLTEDYIPNIIAAVSSFGPDTLDRNYQDIKVSADSKKLKVIITPDKQKYGPGDTVRLEVETTDVSGNPKPAELAVWAIDKALLELSDSKLPNIFTTFWSQRYNSTAENNSLQGIMVSGGAEKGGCFAQGTQVTMSDGSQKNIEDIKIGDTVLSRDPKTGENKNEKVTGTDKFQDPLVLIINRNLKVTPNHLLNINGVWKQAGSAQVGDYLSGTDGAKVFVSSVEYQPGKIFVYNLQVENTHTFFAQGVWVHNEKGGGEDSRGVFKDTAYWNPYLKTGPDGRASVSFKLPDNLTTWAIAAVGATSDTVVGQQTAEIIVTKEVVVRPVVPNILRSGDEILLSTLVQNFTDQSHDFKVELNFDSGDVEPQGESTVKIEPNGLAQVFWRVKPLKNTDAANLVFSAKAVDLPILADSYIQKIPVRALGFYENSAKTGLGTQDFNLLLQDDSNRDATKINLEFGPTLLGTLPSAMKYLVDYPYGCVEQTTSHFVPALIAKEHVDLFKDALAGKDIDDIINTGIERLRLLQQDQGGWQWWHEGNSDPFISAYVIEYLLKAKSLGYKVDQGMLDKAKTYLEQIPSNQMPPTINSYGRQSLDAASQNVSRIYALSLLNDKAGQQELTDFTNLTPDLVAMAALANYQNGFNQSRDKALSQLRSMAKQQGEALYWESGHGIYFGSEDASTAWALRAFISSGSSQDKDTAIKAALYLTNNRHKDYWSNTFATAQVIRAITDFSFVGQQVNPNYAYTVTLDGKVIKSGQIKNYKDSVSIEVPAGSVGKQGSVLSVSKNGTGELYSVLTIKEFRTKAEAAPKQAGLKITRRYINEKGEGVPIGVGDLVKIQLDVEGLPNGQNYAVIEDNLPSGLIPVNRSFNNEQGTGDSSQSLWDGYYGYWGNREVTENGIIIPLTWWSSTQTSFEYEARAVSSGKFSAPPASTELMYSPEVYGRTGVENIEIIPSSEGFAPKITPGRILQSLAASSKNKYYQLGFLILIFIGVLVIVWAFKHYDKENSNKVDLTEDNSQKSSNVEMPPAAEEEEVKQEKNDSQN